MREKPITAKEFIDQLHSDPEWVARHEEKERARLERLRPIREAGRPLVEALNSAGYRVDSIWDLVNTRYSYKGAIPTLLEHLGKPYPDEVKDGIARALAVPDAHYAWPRLVSEYVHADEKVFRLAKQGLACAVVGASAPSDIDKIIELASDRANGGSRILLLRALRRSRRPQAKAALERLADDPQLKTQIGIYREASEGYARRKQRKKGKSS